jgi:hypothetical protein
MGGSAALARTLPVVARLCGTAPLVPRGWLAVAGLALASAGMAPAVIVDRIAVVVGDKIITESEIDQRIRLAAFQNGKPADFSPEGRQMAVQQLVDQRLIEREMDLGKYPRLDQEHRKTLLADYVKSEYKGDAAALEKALASASLKPADLEEDLARQSDLLTFLNLRFRPAVQVTNDDLEKYPEALRAQIELKLTQERADKELDLWLKDQRKRTRIVYPKKDPETADK